MALWQFSESSQALLSQCIEAATFDNNNKWIKKFGKKSEYLNIKEDISEINIENYPNNDSIVIKNDTENENMDIDLQEEEMWREVLDLDPAIHFDHIVKKCIENKSLYVILAQKLPLISVEKLCKHIYKTENINLIFLENFYTSFFPAFLKREPTRLSMHLLMEARCYAVYFNDLLSNVIHETEIPNTMLMDFISMLNIKEQTDFLVMLSHINIPKEVFMYHLSTIHNLYKNSQKNGEIQNYILSKLTEISENCLNDKNYGRFLLDFLQTHRDYKTNISVIENIVESHKSAFRRPCVNVLKEIK